MEPPHVELFNVCCPLDLVPCSFASVAATRLRFYVLSVGAFAASHGPGAPPLMVALNPGHLAMNPGHVIAASVAAARMHNTLSMLGRGGATLYFPLIFRAASHLVHAVEFARPQTQLVQCRGACDQACTSS